jgi:hypothetical protein
MARRRGAEGKAFITADNWQVKRVAPPEAAMVKLQRAVLRDFACA